MSNTYVPTLAKLNKLLRERGVLRKCERLHWDRYMQYWYVSGGTYETYDGNWLQRVYEMSLEEWIDVIEKRRGQGVYRPPHKPQSNPRRDTQRRRMYNSEHAATRLWWREESANGPRAVRMLTWNETVVFFDRVVSQLELLKNSGLKLHDIKGKGRCYYKRSENGVFLRTWGRTKLTILHEIGHALHTKMYKETLPDHGPEFCNILLSLMERFVGPEFRADLEAAMHTKKCKSTSELVKPVQFVEQAQAPDVEIPDLFADVGIAASEQKKS